MVGGERSPDTNWGNTCSLLFYKDRIQNLGVGWVYSSVPSRVQSFALWGGQYFEDTHQRDIYLLNMPPILQKGYQIGRWLEQPQEDGKSGPSGP